MRKAAWPPVSPATPKTNAGSWPAWSGSASVASCPHALHSPIITGFYNPEAPGYDFMKFYDLLKTKGFVIYPGKVTGINSFRIGTIGHVFPEDIDRLIVAVEACRYWV